MCFGKAFLSFQAALAGVLALLVVNPVEVQQRCVEMRCPACARHGLGGSR